MELLPCVGAVVEMQLLSMSRVDLETRQWKVRDGSVSLSLTGVEYICTQYT